MNEVTIEFNTMLGYAGRTTLVDTLVPWDASAVCTGISIGRMHIWRFTPNPDSVLVMVSRGKIDDEADVVIRVGTDTYEFANATIHVFDNTVATMGYWIVQNAAPPTTSIAHHSVETDVELFPNPANNTLTVRSTGCTIRSVRIVNMTGQTLLDNTIHPPSSELCVEVGNFQIGAYIVHVETQEGSIIRKVLLR